MPRALHTKSKMLIPLLLFVAFVVGIFGIAAATGWDETLSAFTRLTGMQLALLLVLSLVNYFFRSLRWYIYTQAMSIDLSFMSGVLHYIGGLCSDSYAGTHWRVDQTTLDLGGDRTKT